MTEIVTVLLLLGEIALGGFIYRYWRFSPWRATLQGRILMAQKWAMFAFIAHILFRRVLDYPGADVVAVVLVGVMVALFWAMFLGLVLAQTAARPVPKRQGSGFVPAEDLERTGPRRFRRR